MIAGAITFHLRIPMLNGKSGSSTLTRRVPGSITFLTPTVLWTRVGWPRARTSRIIPGSSCTLPVNPKSIKQVPSEIRHLSVSDLLAPFVQFSCVIDPKLSALLEIIEHGLAFALLQKVIRQSHIRAIIHHVGRTADLG